MWRCEMHALEQADGSLNLRHGKRNGKAFSPYHHWLKRAHNRMIRRVTKLLLRAGEEPPPRFGYRGWET